MTLISEKEGGVTLKACKSCWLVKYCNAKCQKNHEALTKIGMEQYYPCAERAFVMGAPTPLLCLEIMISAHFIPTQKFILHLEITIYHM